MEQLSQELGSVRQQNSQAMEELASQWQQRLRQAEKDYTRMKVSASHRMVSYALSAIHVHV